MESFQHKTKRNVIIDGFDITFSLFENKKTLPKGLEGPLERSEELRNILPLQ